ncbi:hypothetical protein ABH926_010293 [Catenulispora sp. GP43]|uniref:hypothetical protein n=1 Tax=Catenulispora sp. GP43 TaxID=3156263 RepID=UPI00351465F7
MQATFRAAAVFAVIASAASMSACSSSSTPPAPTGAGAAPLTPRSAAAAVTATTTTTTSPGNPGDTNPKAVAAAWLTAQQVPSFSPPMTWKITVKPDGGDNASKPAHWDSCDTDAFRTFITSENPWEQQEHFVPATGFSAIVFTETQLFFPDTASAQKALTLASSDYTACASAPHNGDLTGAPLTYSVHKTADITGGFAYLHTSRMSDGKPPALGSLDYWGTDAHEYFVQHGNALALITTGGIPATDDSSADTALLQQVASELSTAYTAD